MYSNNVWSGPQVSKSIKLKLTRQQFTLVIKSYRLSNDVVISNVDGEILTADLHQWLGILMIYKIIRKNATLRSDDVTSPR